MAQHAALHRLHAMIFDSEKARGRWGPAAAAARERVRYLSAVVPRPASRTAWAREDLADWCPPSSLS